MRARFLTEAPKAWEEYRSFAERLSGTFTAQTAVIELDGKRIPVGGTTRFDIKQKEDHHLFAYEQVAQPTSEEARAQAANPRYAFRLTRPKGKTDWMLSQLDLKILDGSTVDRDGQPLQERIHHSVARHFEVDWLPLSSVIRQPTFKVLRATAVNRDSRELVRIDFDNGHPLPTGKNYAGRYITLQSGSLLFDPDHYWCLAESRIMRDSASGDDSGPFQRPNETTYEYREGTGRFPILTRVVSRIKPIPAKKTSGSDGLSEYDLRESPEPEDEEFTLTAYGLPEPVGMELPRRSRAWLWFSLGGVAVLAVGLVLRRIARRRLAAPADAVRTTVQR